ncbi:MAG: metal ABC transporter ATP-binding protein [Eubacteriales bacterium]
MAATIKIDHLSVSYDNTRALNDISFVVEEGDFLGVIGPNGGGKSTMLKAILGLVPIAQGSVEICNGVAVGYVPQFAQVDKRFPISVRDAVLTGRLKKGLHLFQKYSDQDKELALEKLTEVGISHLADRQIAQLSGGEFQRMLIARALCVNPKILLLDEPTASVDPQSRELIYQLLTEINKKMTIILVTHDLFAISSAVKSLACLNHTLVHHGIAELNSSIVETLYGCPVDLIAHGVPHRVLHPHDHGGCTC